MKINAAYRFKYDVGEKYVTNIPKKPTLYRTVVCMRLSPKFEDDVNQARCHIVSEDELCGTHIGELTFL